MKKAGKATALALAAAMLIAGCGGQGGAVETAGTRNAEGKYDPQITITIAKQLDENTGNTSGSSSEPVRASLSLVS